MKAFSIAAAAAMLLAAGSLAAAARAEGPRASSANNWPGMTGGAVPAVVPSAPLEGPRASGGTNWPGMTSAPVTEQQAAVPQPAAAPHYVWQEGYDPHGKWHGRWVLAE
ncbi:MAG TPA: hypothetical protein VJR70_10425 [Stellaceae bacterium]|nr:hypothetical protein [Stellaceae bacterium]